MTPDVESPEAERQHHRYRGYQVPWFVHIIWISFWAFAVYYVIRYLFPALQTELFNPP